MKKMFDAGNISVSTARLTEIVGRFGNHPMYIQLFCFFLTASIVTRCLNSLFEKEILVKNGKYIIQGLVFRNWLALNG
nr:hypothetical protein [Desulfobacula sp.]